jgi:AcrR family transcriptional regulator
VDTKTPKLRAGKASRAGSSRLGKATEKRLIAVARKLLVAEGYAQFSMRNVAARAGVHLANVQYYFPTRDDLVRGLMYDTGDRYRALYEQALARAPEDPRSRFEAVLDLNLRDVASAQTRRFFTSLWALLAVLDGTSNKLLSELYAIDIQQLCDMIGPLDPATPASEIRIRATLLAAMIEGLHIVHGAHSRNPQEMKKLTAQARIMGLRIAMGTGLAAPLR